MKKIITLAAIVCLAITSIQASAQNKSVKKIRWGLALETGLPIGNFGSAYSFGAGASFRLAVAIDEKSAVTGTVGAMAFMPKDIAGYDLKAQLNIPIKLGYKYMLTKSLYALGEAGMTNAKVYYPTSGGKVESISSTKFTYAANLGTQLGKFDASLRYEGYSNAGFIGLRLGFNF